MAEYSLAIIVAGAVFRLAQYWANRSLWIDEALLVLNVLGKSAAELIGPIDYHLVAPPGFLLLEQASVSLFGSSEYALRLVPLVAGLASLVLFCPVASRCLSQSAVAVALCLFAISDAAIYYSSETKQYSTDVLVTLVLLLEGTSLISGDLQSFRRAGRASVIGAGLLWFSHPAVFVLSAIGLSLLLSMKRPVRRRQVGFMLVVVGSWAFSFLTFYLLLLRPAMSSPYIGSFFSRVDASVPLHLGPLADAQWIVARVWRLFEFTSGSALALSAAVFSFVGVLSMSVHRPRTLVMLGSPLALCLAASALRMYPFTDRLLLFLAPSVFILTAEGFVKSFPTGRRARTVGAIIAVVLISRPVIDAIGHLQSPRLVEEVRPALQYVTRNWRDGDVAYLYYGAQYAYRHYAEYRGLEIPADDRTRDPDLAEATVGQAVVWFRPALRSRPPALVVGRYSRQNLLGYEADLNQLRGNRRVWVLFTHVWPREPRTQVPFGPDEEAIFLGYLDRLGTRLDTLQEHGASVYLYDLS